MQVQEERSALSVEHSTLLNIASFADVTERKKSNIPEYPGTVLTKLNLWDGEFEHQLPSMIQGICALYNGITAVRVVTSALVTVKMNSDRGSHCFTHRGAT